MADTKGSVAPDPTTERNSTLRSPHSGSARDAGGDQAVSDRDDRETPHSAHTESDEATSVVRTLQGWLDWLKAHDLCPPAFAVEAPPSLMEIVESVRAKTRADSGSHWFYGARMVWCYGFTLPTASIAYLVAWAAMFLTRLLFVVLVAMSVATLLSWMPLLNWALGWMTFPYWWHHLTGW